MKEKRGMFMILIKNVHCFSPLDCGLCDILTGGGKILEIGIDLYVEGAEVVDGHGLTCIPGLIDQHIHIVGGGGEGGFSSKTPEVQLSSLLRGGVTSVVGMLGTDGYSRSIENLISKAKALKEEGISVWTITGSYSYPSCTLTGSVTKDVLFIEEMIGCKIALADHRSSHLSEEEFTRLASEVRVAGMLAKKAGIIVVHMGDERSGFDLINTVLQKTDIPISLFRPTHVSRNPHLLDQALVFNRKGGWIDFTCGDEEKPFAKDYLLAKESGCDMSHITLSSDGQGSWSRYDQNGKCIEVGISSCFALFEELKRMVKTYKIPLSEALECCTINVAKGLNLYPNKGVLQIESDADLLLMNDQFEIDSVMAKGQWMMKDQVLLQKGMFE